MTANRRRGPYVYHYTAAYGRGPHDAVPTSSGRVRGAHYVAEGFDRDDAARTGAVRECMVHAPADTRWVVVTAWHPTRPRVTATVSGPLAWVRSATFTADFLAHPPRCRYAVQQAAFGRRSSSAKKK